MPAVGGARAAVGDWTEIVTKNPFSFDRNDIAIVAPSRPPAPPQEPPRAPKPVLFGTFGIGDNWQATLASGQAGNRKSRPMKVGETIDGWQIVEIHQNSVVVVSGAFRETVSIDSAIQGPRVSERTVGSSVQPAPQTSPSSAAVGSPAPVNNASPPLPPPPPGAAKGHWIDTAFGMKWIEDK